MRVCVHVCMYMYVCMWRLRCRVIDTIYVWFFHSDTDEQSPSTINLLQFWTADNSISGGARLVVDLLADQTKTLPESGACFQQIRLPSCHNDFLAFKRAMDVALGFGAKGYGQF